MRYDYECSMCERRWEIECSVSERPDAPECPEVGCAGRGDQIFLRVPAVVVKGGEYRFDKSKCVMSNGRFYGRSDKQQHEHYRDAFDRQRVQVARERRGFSKNKEDGIEYLGGMPGEMADSIAEQEGDKELVAKDPVPFLKKTGLYMGRD